MPSSLLARRRAVVAAFAVAPVLSACLPVKVGEQAVVAQVRSEPVPDDWDPTLGPDVRLAFAHRFREAILARSDRVEIVEPDALWRMTSPSREAGTEAKASEILVASSIDAMVAHGVRFLVVLGPETPTSRRQVKELAAFYSRWAVETVRRAVVVGLPARDRAGFVSTASGDEKDGWFPGTPLMFTRLYSTADTEGAALTGLARAVAEHVLGPDAPHPVRIGVLASREAR